MANVHMVGHPRDEKTKSERTPECHFWHLKGMICTGRYGKVVRKGSTQGTVQVDATMDTPYLCRTWAIVVLNGSLLLEILASFDYHLLTVVLIQPSNLLKLINKLLIPLICSPPSFLVMYFKVLSCVFLIISCNFICNFLMQLLLALNVFRFSYNLRVPTIVGRTTSLLLQVYSFMSSSYCHLKHLIWHRRPVLFSLFLMPFSDSLMVSFLKKDLSLFVWS